MKLIYNFSVHVLSLFYLKWIIEFESTIDTHFSRLSRIKSTVYFFDYPILELKRMQCL